MRTAGLLALAVLIPSFAHAAVLINEIAWMGTTVSANAEWIELVNTGSAPVDLSGWQLTSSSGAPTISLTGTIAANGFYLLERSSDDSVPGISADQIYTGSLSNSGTLLKLVDAGGTAVDSVDGTGNWAGVGGDNTTKDTAQRTSTGWTTATPTPRAANAGSGAGVTPSSDPVSTTTTAVVGQGAETYVPPPTGSLTVLVQADTEKPYLHVPLRFTATVRTKSGAVDSAASVVWSFGEGSSGMGTSVTKTYRYSGTYIVKARATDGTAEGESDITVVIAAPDMRIARVTGDGITIANDSDERVDLSNWELFSGTGTFRMPPGTTLLPKSETLFPYTIINVPQSFDVRLTYPDRMLAAIFVPAAPVPSALVVDTATSTQPVAATMGSYVVQTVVKPAGLSRSLSVLAHATQTVSAPAASAQVAAVGAVFPPTASTTSTAKQKTGIFTSPWTLSFLGLVAVAGGALLIL